MLSVNKEYSGDSMENQYDWNIYFKFLKNSKYFYIFSNKILYMINRETMS